MRSIDLVKMLNKPESTIRKYVGEYRQYLSPGAAGGGGKHREYTELDARILKLIIDMRHQHESPDSIAATLSASQANNWDRLPELQESVLSLANEGERRIADRAVVSALEREVEVLRGMLDKERVRSDDLLGQLRRAETLLELYQAGKLKPD